MKGYREEEAMGDGAVSEEGDGEEEGEEEEEERGKRRSQGRRLRKEILVGRLRRRIWFLSEG